MAYLRDDNQDEGDELEILRNRGKGNVQEGGPGALPLAAPSALPSAAPGISPVATPSRFVNFDRMLAANQGVAQRMAGEIGDQIQTGAEAGEKLIKSGEEQFLGGLDTGRGAVDQAYSGPTSVYDNADFQSGVSKLGKASEQAQALSTSGGIQALLQDKYKSASGMDGALAGAAGQERFRGLKDKLGKMTNPDAGGVAGESVQANAVEQTSRGYMNMVNQQAQAQAVGAQRDAQNAAAQAGAKDAENNAPDPMQTMIDDKARGEADDLAQTYSHSLDPSLRPLIDGPMVSAMSEEERAWLRRMPPAEAKQWLEKRRKEAGLPEAKSLEGRVAGGSVTDWYRRLTGMIK